MKKIILSILALIVVGGALFGGFTYITNNKSAEENVKAARQAVDQGDWLVAKKYYQKVQNKKPSVEARTALQQLNLLVAGDKATRDKDYETAVNQYNAALKVDGGLARINNKIKEMLPDLEAKKNDQKADAKSAKSAANAEVSGSSSVTSASASKASSSTVWGDASSSSSAIANGDLASAYDFSAADVAAARAELKSKFSNVDQYDDNNIKKVMAMSLLNKTSLEEAYTSGGWGK